MESQDTAPKQRVIPRACHNCRARKVRCNRLVPCSNCTISGLDCPRGGNPRSARPTEDAQVSSLPSQDTLSYFARFETKLADLQLEVDGLKEQLKNRGSTDNTVPSPHCSNSSNPVARQHDVFGDHTQEEGDSSFGRQALNAIQVAELTSSESSHSPAVAQQLANLRDMAREHEASGVNRDDYISAPVPATDNLKMRLPPSMFVLAILRVLRERKGVQPILYYFHGVYDRLQIEKLCRRIYFPLDSVSAAEVTLLNGMLSVVLRELDNIEDSEITSEEITRYQRICESQFQTGLEVYEVMAMPTRENVMILVIGMVHAQIRAKLPLQWSLTSTAARHCLALGYHREHRVSRLPSAEASSVRRLFWHIYIADKNLSSRLGRTSIIQDLDVDTGLNAVSDEPGRTPWDQAFASFVEFARIQGKIYDSLYSPAAKKQQPEHRVAVAIDLESQLSTWHANWTKIDFSEAFDYESFAATFGPADIIYYSSLTLIHRGTASSGSAQDISPACYEAAHQGLQAHLNYYPRLSCSADHVLSNYAFWIFYYTSFTPFVVTFLHCIAHSDHGDLTLLQEVLSSLEQVGSALDYAEKQLFLCKALFRIAEAFLNSHTTTQNNHTVTGSTATFCIPLQNPFSDEWAGLDRFLEGTEDWDMTTIDPASFLLDDAM
ncbi:Fungal-trans domain-containing protein [Fusarium keratoplasticum]|uniref:Fungal-trans domain-containing protein n=1 Tax=Fusarium keratoplasticum TaxID=1328300 RepID=A0ACC0R672_9HYPO|nr:Fungal-trans domain-containing protein [Fusarium keratoplasticum]KAI8675850.1 Fungal-trans domain-containing protein [Fusarium keratoplasticum]